MELTSRDFRELRKAVHDLCGLALGDDKEYLVTSRLQPILELNALTSYESLVQRLQQPDAGRLRDQVIAAITTNETSFNRDGHPFETLRQHVLPELAERLRERRVAGRFGGQQVRIWCAAVATGQEAYSVAMAIHELLWRKNVIDLNQNHFAIIGSDISEPALAAARAALYTPAEMDRGVTSDQRAKYFRLTADGWSVIKELRDLVDFRRQNLVRLPPETEAYDLILCRNVMIYFDQPTRCRLAQMFYDSLRPQGLLMLGAAESLFGTSDAFTTLMFGRTTLYRKP